MAIQKIPPPPPPTARVLSILFAVLALGAVFFRAWGFCTTFTTLSLVFNVWAFTQFRAWAGRVADAKAAGASAAGRMPVG